MFFTQELLSRRDSGFGLMWLVATLGPKPSFKKLPKRDVMDADVSQLCDLIADPVEPLALRLSSNLMVGVARIYKLKYEIFLGDVTAFHTTLKKTMQEIATAALDLQMLQPSVRPETVTMAQDPALASGFNYDDFLDRWLPDVDAESSDDEYGKRKKRTRKIGVPPTEKARGDLHILDESMEFLVSGSFDASLFGSGTLSGIGDHDYSSSQIDAGIGFDVYQDDALREADSFDMGEIGDELAKELGDGWTTAAPTQARPTLEEDAMDVDNPFQMGQDPGINYGDEFMLAPLVDPSDDATARVRESSIASARKRPHDEIEFDPSQQNDNLPGGDGALTPRLPEAHMDGNNQLTATGDDPAPKTMNRKAKRAKLLLDARTELTDEELKTARSHYLDVQKRIRREMETRKMEKESARIIEEMLWGVPRGLQAPALADFWVAHVKEKMVVRAGDGFGDYANRLDQNAKDEKRLSPLNTTTLGWGELADTGLEYGDQLANDAYMYHDRDEYLPASYIGSAHQRSSEEPGQARRGSLPPSPLGGQFDFALRQPLDPEPTSAASQRSAVFPWDHAGPSSSSAGGHFDLAHDQISVGHEEVHIRRPSSVGSRSRRDSSVISSLPVGRGFSPSAFQKLSSQIIGGEFEFEVPEEEISHVGSAQDATLVKLERNSFNFLEYVRMQARSVSQASGSLAFEAIVPKATSTKHIAAAAFYHCLVLAGKDLIRVHQAEPYGEIVVSMV